MNNISLETKISKIKNYIMESDNLLKFGFKEEDFNNLKNIQNFGDISNNELLSILYIIIESNKIETSRIQKSRITKLGINEFYKNLFNKIYTNISTYKIEELSADIKKFLFINIPPVFFEKFQSTTNSTTSTVCEWLFKIYYMTENILNLETDVLKSSKTKEINNDCEKLINFILQKIHQNIVITINRIQFIVQSYYTCSGGRRCIDLLTYSSLDNKINNITYYCSNSELGLMRFKANITNSDGSQILAKYLDYATETLINFKLQKEINNKIIKFGSLIKNTESFNSLEWDNSINLNLLRIEKLGDVMVENRCYFSPLLYCFSTINCGEVFSGNYYSNILNFNDIMIDLIKKIKINTNINLKENYNKELNIMVGEQNYRIGNFIPFNSIAQSKEKILKLIEIVNDTKINIIDIKTTNGAQYKTTEYLTLHYNMLGKMLDVIIDKIIDDEKNIFEYTYELDGIVENKYIFNVSVNKLIVLIDEIEYNIYYNDYCVKEIFDKFTSDFDNEIKNYISIVKISLTSDDDIISSGVDNSFIIAGSLQCKPIEYIIQLTAILNISTKPKLSDPNYYEKKIIYDKNLILQIKKDNNYLNMEYYFIGRFVNLIFENFTKFIEYEESNDTKHLKNKYIKYKNKYTNYKKNH